MTAAAPPQDHVVTFYDHDGDLVASVADYVAAGLAAGEAVVAVVTEVHRQALTAVLAQRGVLLDAERFVTVDAEQTLASLRGADGGIDLATFGSLATDLLDRAGADGRPVRVFGEMVALLWAEGDVAGALQLEAAWNDLASTRSFGLLCGYPTSSVCGAGGLAGLADVCAGHARVFAPCSYDTDVVVLGHPVGAHGRTETFVPVPAAVRMARRFVTCTLQAWGRQDAVPDAELLVSELATNALQHGRTPFTVDLSRDADGVRIAVVDLCAAVPEQQPSSTEAFSGRGVSLVEALASEWGVSKGTGGKSVWARLPGAAPLACTR